MAAESTLGICLALLILCFFASLLLCFFASLLLCFFASLLLCFFASLLLCFFASLLLCFFASLLLCFFASLLLCFFASLLLCFFASLLGSFFWAYVSNFLRLSRQSSHAPRGCIFSQRGFISQAGSSETCSSHALDFPHLTNKASCACTTKISPRTRGCHPTTVAFAIPSAQAVAFECAQCATSCAPSDIPTEPPMLRVYGAPQNEAYSGHKQNQRGRRLRKSEPADMNRIFAEKYRLPQVINPNTGDNIRWIGLSRLEFGPIGCSPTSTNP